MQLPIRNTSQATTLKPSTVVTLRTMLQRISVLYRSNPLMSGPYGQSMPLPRSRHAVKLPRMRAA
jgi:hypothetical protein